MSAAEDTPTAVDQARLADELDLVRAEREALRAERDDLRRLLGLSPALREAHRAVVNETLLDDATSELFTDVNMRSAPARKIALFASLFRGREDVYAQRWSNEQTGKSGYAPAVRRGASAREHLRSKDDRALLPMTARVVEQHLRGAIVTGIYPMLTNGTCWLLACDFDGEGWALDALAYLRACAGGSVPAALERSRSGNGAHVWTFFSEPVPAVTARRLAMQLLRAAMDERCELDLASYDRLFPSQDHVPKGGFGNLIALPLQPAARARGNSEFLDPSTLEPWPDQWRFLAQIKRIGASAVDELIQYLPPIDIGPDSGVRARRRTNESPPPANIACTLSSQFSVERSGLPPSLVSALKHSAMLHNPAWHQRTKLRLSTYDVPRFVRCYREDLAHLHIPRGLQDRACALIEQAGSAVDLVDARPVHPGVEFAFGLDLSDGQQTALTALDD